MAVARTRGSQPSSRSTSCLTLKKRYCPTLGTLLSSETFSTFTTYTGHSERWSYISDYVSPKRSGPSRYGNKPCSHDKGTIAVQNLQEHLAGATTDWNSWCPIHGTQHRPIIKYEWAPGWQPLQAPPTYTPTIADSETWRANAMRQLAEKMPRKVSLVNFFLELGDVKSLLDSAQKVSRTLQKHGGTHTLRGLRKLGRRNFASSRKKVREIARDTALASSDAHLAWNFGVLPFVDDVKEFFNLESSIRKRIDWLKKTHGKKTSVRRKRTLQLSNVTLRSQFAGPPGFSSSYDVETLISNIKVTQVLGATAFQRFDGLDSANSILRFRARALGLDRPFSVIWEAIPFSFLIDYFVDMGKIADEATLLPEFSGSVGLENPWFSQHVEYDFYTVAKLRSTGATRGVAQGSRSFYTRATNFTLGGGLSVDSSLNEDQVKNIWALLIQRGL
jgi:hypothetical protein